MNNVTFEHKSGGIVFSNRTKVSFIIALLVALTNIDNCVIFC